MRIAFVTHQYPPTYNTGTELYAKRLALKIRGTFGHDVRIFTFEPSYMAGRQGEPFVRREETVDDGVAVTRVCMWPGLVANFSLGDYYNVFLGKIFKSYLDDVRPDLVHFFHTAFLGASVIEEAFLKDVPTVVNLMDFWFICPVAQLLKTRTQKRCDGPSPFGCLECLSHGDMDYDRLLTFSQGDRFLPVFEEVAVAGDGLRWNNPSPHAALTALAARQDFLRGVLLRADKVVAPSNALKRLFVRFGYDPARIDVLRYGVDPMPPFTFDRQPSASLRLGFIGSINRPKGLHVLLDAFARLSGDVTLDIFGNPDMFPDYAQECITRAREDQRVHVRGGMRPEHIGTALRDVDVLVVPSLWLENTPFVVLEARAAGVPVVGADVDGIAEIVADGVNGRLFPAGDSEALRNLLQELVDDREQVKRLSGKFGDVRTLLANAREFTMLYEQLTGLGAGPRRRPSAAAPSGGRT
jgi:glycosyltransferase involved in cell wall biosynthesis